MTLVLKSSGPVTLVRAGDLRAGAGPGLARPREQAVAYPADVLSLSVGVAIILLLPYGAGLLFSLKTHAHLFNPAHGEDDHGGEPWTLRRSVSMLAVAGNAAEHWVSVYFALRNKIDLSINIAVGSGAQITLFVAPVLVLASFAVGPFPMALVLNRFEIGAIFGR